MKSRWCVGLSVILFACLAATGKCAAAENTNDKNEVVKPARNNVPVYTASRVLIGFLDKDAQVQILLEAGEWCKVQYTKDGSRFVGWVRKGELALPESPPPKNEEETQPRILSIEETSEQLRKLVCVYVDYKSTRGDSWNPKVTVGVSHPVRGQRQMKLSTSDKGMPAKLMVLRRFRRDHVIELYVEKKIVDLKQFRKIANPRFERIIDSYIRGLEAYNEDKIPDFRRLVESAENFWETIETMSL